MQSKVVTLATLVAIATSVTAEVERPRIYFPRQIKRQIQNSTVTESEELPVASTSSTSSSTRRDFVTSTKSTSFSDFLSSIFNQEPSSSDSKDDSDKTTTPIFVSTSKSEEGESSTGPVGTGNSPITSVEPTKSSSSSTRASSTFPVEEPEESSSESPILVGPTGIVSSTSSARSSTTSETSSLDESTTSSSKASSSSESSSSEASSSEASGSAAGSSTSASSSTSKGGILDPIETVISSLLPDPVTSTSTSSASSSVETTSDSSAVESSSASSTVESSSASSTIESSSASSTIISSSASSEPDTNSTTVLSSSTSSRLIDLPTLTLPTPSASETSSEPIVSETSSSVPIVSETSTSVPIVSETSTSVPVSETSSSVPVSETSTSVPISETSTSVPISETSSSVPVSETSTSAPPPVTSSASVSETGSATLPPVSQSSSLPPPDTNSTTSETSVSVPPTTLPPPVSTPSVSESSTDVPPVNSTSTDLPPTSTAGSVTLPPVTPSAPLSTTSETSAPKPPSTISTSVVVEPSTSAAPSASSTQEPVTAITPTATRVSASDNVQTSIFIETTSNVYTEPSSLPSATVTSLPPNIPKKILPADDNADAPLPEGTVEVQIGFLFPLNYMFVSKNTDAAAQIFKLLPKALTDAAGLDGKKIQISKLVPYDTRDRWGYVTTIAKFAYPETLTQRLQMDISSPNSPIYQNENNLIRNLTAIINPKIGIFGSFEDDTSKTNGGDGPGHPRPNDAFDNGNSDQQSSSQRATTAGIAVGAVGLSVMYGAAMFIVARRYKRKRQHQRASSLGGSDASSEMRFTDRGSPALMGGALMSREFSNYGGVAGGRDSHGSGRSGQGGSVRTAAISAPVAAENSLGWN